MTARIIARVTISTSTFDVPDALVERRIVGVRVGKGVVRGFKSVVRVGKGQGGDRVGRGQGGEGPINS